MRPPSADLEAIKARYGDVPRVATAKNAGQLVDLIVRHELFQSPKKSYSSAMREVLDADPALKALYGR